MPTTLKALHKYMFVCSLVGYVEFLYQEPTVRETVLTFFSANAMLSLQHLGTIFCNSRATQQPAKAPHKKKIFWFDSEALFGDCGGLNAVNISRNTIEFCARCSADRRKKS